MTLVEAYRTAIELLAEYGAGASKVAMDCARECEANGDPEGARAWNKVHQSIAEIERTRAMPRH
jgi:hypothetical protein